MESEIQAADVGAWSPQEYLPTLRALLAAAEVSDQLEFQNQLDKLTALREQRLFQEIGRLTRQLHDALTSFQSDSRLLEVAGSEFPDARDRLDQVIEMTERSAHRTMDLIETAIPLAEQLQDTTAGLASRWQRFRARELSADEFRELVAEIGDYFTATDDRSRQLRARLSDILMAQDFQDLSGQEIRKVIRLVQDVEKTLLNMIKVAGRGESIEAELTEKKTSEETDWNKQRVSGQDEADELLSSLGF
ncbi:MAG: protein phosphatase CheZ [Wenzhouxiangellaceae bacterium]|nr:protein phosphatase CheZ [Wenzhouxiangellaceae bacterium]